MKKRKYQTNKFTGQHDIYCKLSHFFVVNIVTSKCLYFMFYVKGFLSGSFIIHILFWLVQMNFTYLFNNGKTRYTFVSFLQFIFSGDML